MLSLWRRGSCHSQCWKLNGVSLATRANVAVSEVMNTLGMNEDRETITLSREGYISSGLPLKLILIMQNHPHPNVRLFKLQILLLLTFHLQAKERGLLTRELPII